MIAKKYGLHPKSVECEEEFVKNWRPLDAWTIQDHNGFVLPTHHSKWGVEFYKSYKKTILRGFLYVFAVTCLVACICFYKTSFHTTQLALVSSLLLTYVLGEILLSTKTYKSCKQKTEFLYNTTKVFKSRFLFFVPIFSAMLILQLCLTEKVGSFENLVMSYGNYYPEIEWGSIWRFFIGPYIHGDTEHWLLNAVLTITFAAMIPTSKTLLVFVLFSISAVGTHIIAFFVHLYFETPFDALLGVSGGTYALLAYSICCYLKKEKLYTVASLIMLGIFVELMANMMASNTSYSAHLSGFIIGLFLFTVRAKGSTYHRI